MTKKNAAEEPKRLTPKTEVLRSLFLLSGNECAMPDCKTVLIDSVGSMVGDIAHIAAAMPGGQRFDPSMTNEDRRAFDNLLLLCRAHHGQVDGGKTTFTAEALKLIKAQHEARFSAVEDTIRKQFETQYPDATDDVMPTKATSLDGLQKMLGEDFMADGDVETELPKLEHYVDQLAKVPEIYRDFMCQVIKRAWKLDAWQFDRSSVLCEDLTAALGVSAAKLKRNVTMLDRYGLADLGEDNDGEPVVDIYDPGDIVRWADIAHFCDERGIPLESFVVELSFGQLGL